MQENNIINSNAYQIAFDFFQRYFLSAYLSSSSPWILNTSLTLATWFSTLSKFYCSKMIREVFCMALTADLML